MTDDAGSEENAPRTLRPGARLVAAAVLLLGGVAAVAFGVANQDAPPPSPPARTTAAASPIEAAPPASSSLPATAAPAPSRKAPEPRILPAEIRIPSIGVTSAVTQIGLNPDGTLAVPQPGPDYDKAAWYEGSPTPGQTGPSVIEGHVDSAENGPSVFYDLGKLVPGETIDITLEDRSVVTFVVDEVLEFPKDAFPTERVYGNTDRPELRLITCGGEFDSKRGHYVNNTVVFAYQA